MDSSYPRWMRSSGTATRLMPLKLNSSSTRYTEGSAETCFTMVPSASCTERVTADDPCDQAGSAYPPRTRTRKLSESPTL